MCSLDEVNSLNGTSDIHLNHPKMIENKKEARQRSINNQKFLTAIHEKNLERVSSLIGKEVDINFRDQDGWTPLHWAVETGDLKIIETLLKNGVDLHSRNNYLETPLDLAKQINCPDIVNILEKSLHSTNKSRTAESKKGFECDRQSTSSQDQDIVWINPVHGYIYQLKVLMLFLHRGLSYNYSFRLGTEIKEAKKFDDLVFEYMEDNKKVYRLLQAKHKFDESKKITVDKLLTEIKGDYSLVKYFYSFQACKKDNFFKDGIIKDVIICTNIDFDLDDLKSADIEIRKVEEKDDILDMKSKEKEPTRYKFTSRIIGKLRYKLKPPVSDDEINDFLSHLTFAVNQPNEEELGQIVKEEINREIGFIDTENAYNKLLGKMMDLSLGKGASMFLSHKEGKKFFDDLKRDIPIWFNIQNPISSFTGRLEDLKKMHKILMKKFCMCISGIGGLGKTELVRKYIADHGDKYDNQIVWINAESYRTVADSFRQLASDKLNISLKNSDGKEKHISSIVADVYQYFSKKQSLFIFDNAEKYKCEFEFDCGIDQFLPCLPDNCVKPKIIVTSRNQKWPECIKTIVLKALTVDEAKQLVEKKLSFENDEEKELIVEFVEKLQFLPLALQQAVAYIKEQKEKLACIEVNFGISNYLNRYSEMTYELLDFKFSEDSDSQYDKSVFATWNITFDSLKKRENGQVALDILNIISFLLPDNVPIDLLLNFSTDKQKLSAAIGLLKQYSIVSVQHKAISVHRLVQQVTRITLQRQNKEVMVLTYALNQLDENYINYKNVDQILSLWTFARKYTELLEECSRLTTPIIAYLRESGRIDEAISIGTEISKLLRTPSENHKAALYYLLRIRNNVAMCKLLKGQYGKALQEFQEIYDRQKTILNPSHRHVLATKNNMGYALMQLNRREEAIKCFYELLDGYRVNLEENHPNILLAKSTLSTLLSEEGRFEKAFAIVQEVNEMQENAPQIFSEKTIMARVNTASVLSSENKLEDSLITLEKALIELEAICPKNHTSIISTKFNIAHVLTAQGKCTAAMKIYEEVFSIESERLGKNHPEVVTINIRIAINLKMQGKHKKALEILNSSLAKFKTTLGLMHSDTLQIEWHIADVLCRQKKYAAAMKILKDLLDKQISVFGNICPFTYETRKLMLPILADQGRFKVAVALGLELIYHAETIYGKNHSNTLNDKRNLGCVYFNSGDFDKAMVVLKQVLEVQESTLGKDHADYQETNKIISEVLKVIKTKSGVFVNANDLVCSQNGTVNSAGHNGKDPESNSMLFYALNVGDEQMIEVLLNGGADVFVTNNEGETPLHVAVSKGKEKFVKMLLEKVKPAKLKDFVEAKTHWAGSTALHIAAKKNHFGIVKYLLNNHAMFCTLDKNGKRPLNLSRDTKIKNFFKMVHEIFENVKQADATEVVRKLESLTSDEFLAVTNARNDQGSTLTQVAIKNNQKQVAVQILQMMQNLRSM